LKLPKGVKRLKSSGSPTALQDALNQLCAEEFNGFVRASAPQGVKEACILVFLQNIPQLAVYQSPDRSVYGPEALVELVRISKAAGSVVRGEAFFAHDLVEVDAIVTKMRRASVSGKDLAAAGIRAPGPSRRGTTPAPPKVVMPPKAATPTKARPPQAVAPTSPPRVVPKVTTRPREALAPAQEDEAAEEDGMGAEEEEEEPPKEEDARGDRGGAHAVRPPGPRGPAAPMAVQRVAAAKGMARDDDEFLQMLKEVGIKPSPGGSQAEGDISEEDIDQYIAAFETYIDKAKGPEPGPSPERIKRVVDEIIDEMATAAGDDEWTRAFIESQREVVLDKVRSSTSKLDEMAHRRDRISEERRTLTDISKTFQDVLRATQEEARRHKEELDEIAEEEGLEDSDWLKNESSKLDQQADRMQEMERALGAVLSTHQRRMERIESDLEEVETEATTDVKRELVDLESLKKDFLTEMRDRIRGMTTTAEGAPSVEGAARAARSISEGIHDQVAQLEHERDDLERVAHRLEGETEEAEEASTEMDIDRTVEVHSRIEELEQREEALRKRESELLDRERRLEADRVSVEEELTRSREQQTRLRELEEGLQRREDEVEARETETRPAYKSGPSTEAEAQMKELRAMEARLKAREMQLVARESELDKATERTRLEREEDEEDLKRVEELELELHEREEQYSDAQRRSEERIEGLKDELGTAKARLKEMEDRIRVLQKAEERARKLEAAVEGQKAAAAAGGDMADPELKKILLYLDDLLAHLPDNVIAEFSESEYFELYDKVLRRLGI
jgi:hypothetical protein